MTSRVPVEVPRARSHRRCGLHDILTSMEHPKYEAPVLRREGSLAALTAANTLNSYSDSSSKSVHTDGVS